MVMLLNIIERSVKFNFPIEIAILDGYVSEDKDHEIQCSLSYAPISPQEWKKYLSNLTLTTDSGDKKYTVKEISASKITNRYSLVVNPFGEFYPEIDIEKKVIFSIIEDYIFNGGIFVC